MCRRLIEVGDVELATGGSVANTGLAMRKYGLDVTLMGMVGRDPFGRIVMDILEKSGNVDGVIVTDKCSTTYSIVLAPPASTVYFCTFRARTTYSAMTMWTMRRCAARICSTSGTRRSCAGCTKTAATV